MTWQEALDAAKVVDGSPGNPREWNGRDALERVFGTATLYGWGALPSWGARGWNIGDWPVLVYATRTISLPREGANRFQVARVEVDRVTVWSFDSEAERDAAIDRLALAQWIGEGREWAIGFADVPDDVAAIPDRLRGAYSLQRAAADLEREVMARGGEVEIKAISEAATNGALRTIRTERRRRIASEQAGAYHPEGGAE